ncbi:hypothetical protein D3C81_1316910 [compost metagenome]
MAGFMHDAEQCGQKFFVVVAGGNTNIFRYAAAEWVSADVHATAVEVKAEQLHHAQAQLTLGFHIERPLRNQTRFLGLFGHHLLQQVGQPGFQVTKDTVYIAAAHSRFIKVQQGIITTATCRFGTDLRFLAAQFNHFAQILRETFPVVGWALGTPGMFTACTGQGFSLDQRFWYQHCIVILAAHLQQIRLVNAVQRFLLCAFKQTAGFIRR